MNQTFPLFSMLIGGEAAQSHIMAALTAANLRVERSFDMQVARLAHTECSCPHHGTEECDCQLVVLLVYDHKSPPATLILHGRDNFTNISLVDSPMQLTRMEHITNIKDILAAEFDKMHVERFKS